MSYDVIYSFAIGAVGAIMFLLVDKFEPEGPMARLKALVLFVSAVAILHRLRPYGFTLFYPVCALIKSRVVTATWMSALAYFRTHFRHFRRSGKCHERTSSKWQCAGRGNLVKGKADTISAERSPSGLLRGPGLNATAIRPNVIPTVSHFTTEKLTALANDE
jgi:hypothetical protein